MLEKVKGNIHVLKLQALLLLKDNFNALCKIKHNARIVPQLTLQPHAM